MENVTVYGYLQRNSFCIVICMYVDTREINEWFYVINVNKNINFHAFMWKIYKQCHNSDWLFLWIFLFVFSQSHCFVWYWFLSVIWWDVVDDWALNEFLSDCHDFSKIKNCCNYSYNCLLTINHGSAREMKIE